MNKSEAERAARDIARLVWPNVRQESWLTLNSKEFVPIVERAIAESQAPKEWYQCRGCGESYAIGVKCDLCEELTMEDVIGHPVNRPTDGKTPVGVGAPEIELGDGEPSSAPRAESAG